MQNSLIVYLYNKCRSNFRTKVISETATKMFKDLNDFRDRVDHLLTTDYFKPEDKIPNYFRNLMGKDNTNLNQK